MADVINLTDDTLDSTLNNNTPALLLFTTGEGLRGDFITAFRKAAAENDGITFAKINPQQNPRATERFEVGKKPVLIAWRDGDILMRRSRPWGSDVPSLLEALQARASVPEDTPQANQTIQAKEHSTVPTEPVHVTDDTFEEEVINSDLPVLIDFWADWCGPCKMVAPILDKLAGEFAGDVKIAKVDVDNNPALAQSFQIMSIPNMMAVKNKTIVFNQPGALPEPALRDLIQQLIALEVPPPEEQEQAENQEQSAD